MHAADFATLRTFYDGPYKRLCLRGASDNTHRLYRNTLGNLRRFLGREPVWGDLNDDTIISFSSWFLERKRSPHTANKCVGQVLALWRFACRKGVVPNWPDVALERCPERDPLAWLRHELEALYIAIEAEQGNYGHVRRSVWWHALHALIWDTAERIGAVMKLDWADVDLTGGWVRFPAETRKGRRRDKTHKLHPDTVAVLRSMRRPQGRVFPWPYLSGNLLYTHYEKILIRAGLPTNRQSKFHRLRKSSASWFTAAGGDAMELLDHSSRRVTQKYLDPRVVTRRHACELLFRPQARKRKA